MIKYVATQSAISIFMTKIGKNVKKKKFLSQEIQILDLEFFRMLSLL